MAVIHHARSHTTMLLVFAGPLLLPALLAGQQVPTGPLKPADGVVNAPFANVLSMHELHDGRVLMGDAMKGLMLVGDFSTGRYTSADGVPAMPLFALPGDTTVSAGPDGRWVFVDGAKPIGMLDQTNPVVKAVGLIIDGADLSGNLLGTVTAGPGHGDSINLQLVSRVTARADTITRLWYARAAPNTRPVYAIYESGRLAIDGWIVVLRANPYRVDWRSPDGKWTLGEPLPVPVIPMDEREKMEYMVWRARGGKPQPVESITNWPDAVAPWSFFNLSPILSPDGKVLVLRVPTADFPATRYDVINRQGKLERQVTLPAQQFILGFGAKSVYVVIPHGDKPQTVERHPWP